MTPVIIPVKRHLGHLHSTPGEMSRRSELMDVPARSGNINRQGRLPSGDTCPTAGERTTRGDKYSTYLFSFCFTILKQESKHVQFPICLQNVKRLSHSSHLWPPGSWFHCEGPGVLWPEAVVGPLIHDRAKRNFLQSLIQFSGIFLPLASLLFNFNWKLCQIKIKDEVCSGGFWFNVFLE